MKQWNNETKTKKRKRKQKSSVLLYLSGEEGVWRGGGKIGDVGCSMCGEGKGSANGCKWRRRWRLRDWNWIGGGRGHLKKDLFLLLFFWVCLVSCFVLYLDYMLEAEEAESMLLELFDLDWEDEPPLAVPEGVIASSRALQHGKQIPKSPAHLAATFLLMQ